MNFKLILFYSDLQIFQIHHIILSIPAPPALRYKPSFSTNVYPNTR